MKPVLLTNDWHLGVQRSGGTTPQSAAALRQYLLESFRNLIMAHTDKGLCVNGDLFDQLNIPLSDLLSTYQILAGWLEASSETLVLGMGNHDAAKNSANLSSFSLLGQILNSQYPSRVKVVAEPQEVFHGVVMVPHLANQDIFNMALEELTCENSVVLLHANWANDFAANADHSLNVIQSQAKRLIERGNTLVFGHEHVAKRAFAGNLIVTGNQFPSSVSDCTGNDTKYAHVIQTGEDGLLDVVPFPTWAAEGDYCDTSWELLNDAPADARFIRVSGNATAAQAGDAIAAISKFRQKSSAFVVTNAVKIEGSAELSELPQSMETAKTFDVLAYLYENLDPEEAAVVQQLLKQAEPMKEAA